MGMLDHVDWYWLRYKKIYETCKQINMLTEPWIRGDELRWLEDFMDKHDMPLWLDFTPMGYRNLDLALLNWYRSHRDLEFDRLIFYEWDLYSRRSVDEIYGDVEADAAFVSLQPYETHRHWRFRDRPRGSINRLMDFIEGQGEKPMLYTCIFAGGMISNKALEALASLEIERNLQYGFCEIRLPSLLKSLGYEVEALNLFVRATPVVSREELRRRGDEPMLHPVTYVVKH